MKKRIGILAAAAFAFTACGTSLYTSSSGQRFNDGIYSYAPAPAEKEYAQAPSASTDAETGDMIRKTKESEIYLFSDTGSDAGPSVDSILIAGNKSAIINFDNSKVTSITVTDSPYDWNSYNWYNDWTFYNWTVSPFWDPWYYGYWGFARPWRYYSAWYWNPWYYDPWYYDPWYYGYWGRPWWYYHCGWYDGWAPAYHPGHGVIHYGPDRYYGSRYSTGSRSAVSSRTRAYAGASRSAAVSGTRGSSYSRGISRNSTSGLSMT